MKEVTGYTNLYRRNATYYFRAVIPFELREVYGKTEEKFSLKTKDKQEAISRWRQASSDLDEKIQHARAVHANSNNATAPEITPALLDEIKERVYSQLMQSDEQMRMHGFTFSGEPDKAIPFNAAYEKHKSGIREINLPRIQKEYASGNTDNFKTKALRELSLPETQRNVKEVIEVARAIQEAYLRFYQDIDQKNDGKIINFTRQETCQKPKQSRNKKLNTLPLLSEAINTWTHEKKRTSWSESTERHYTTWANYFLEALGDKHLDEYTKQDALDFKNALLNLPSNYKHVASLKHLHPIDASKEAQRLNLEPASPTTSKKNLGFVASLWNWINQNYDLEKNIFSGIKIVVTRKAKEERDPFSEEDLKILFSSDLYKDCKELTTTHQWIPLIALYTGARSNEILQLTTDDIRKEQGIYIFDFNLSDYKEAKTISSRRLTPIHQKLLDAGLLDFIQQRAKDNPNQNNRVFYDIPLASDGTYSKNYGKQFTRVIEKLGIKKDKKKTFHSFRHTFSDACRAAGIPKEVMKELIGHGENDISARYGSGHKVPQLSEHLQTISYNIQLEVSHR